MRDRFKRSVRFLKVFSVFLLPVALQGNEPESAPQEETLSYVTCNVKGGLGNQLFEIATTLALAWDHGAIPVFPDLNRDKWSMRFHKEKMLFRIDTSESPYPFTALYSDPDWCSSKPIPFYPNLKIDGYFQLWTRFHHHRDKLLELFAPSQAVLDALEDKYGDLLANPKTVSVHLRLANFQKHSIMIHYFMGLEYYRRAMSLFPEDTLFVVFADRINWCKKHFPELGRPCVFIEGNDEIEDLFLMSKMKHHIIPNSTFSWWASYLDTNPDSITIAPESWQHPALFPFPMTQPNPFYLPHWTLIAPDCNEPYPSDAEDYDTNWDGDVNDS